MKLREQVLLMTLICFISDQDTASSNKFSACTNNSDDISVTKIRESSEKIGLRQSNDNIPKQLVTTCKVRKIWLPIRREKITSVATAKIPKNKNMPVIIRDSIIKDIKG